MRTINHSSTVINPRGPVVACCFVWNLLVRAMRPLFSSKASLGSAQGNREEGLLSEEARRAMRIAEQVRREACMVQSRLTPSRTGPQASLGAAEPTIPPQGADSVLRTPGSCATAPNSTDVKARCWISPYDVEIARHLPLP